MFPVQRLGRQKTTTLGSTLTVLKGAVIVWEAETERAQVSARGSVSVASPAWCHVPLRVPVTRTCG